MPTVVLEGWAGCLERRHHDHRGGWQGGLVGTGGRGALLYGGGRRQGWPQLLGRRGVAHRIGLAII